MTCARVSGAPRAWGVAAKAMPQLEEPLLLEDLLGRHECSKRRGVNCVLGVGRILRPRYGTLLRRSGYLGVIAHSGQSDLNMWRCSRKRPLGMAPGACFIRAGRDQWCAGSNFTVDVVDFPAVVSRRDQLSAIEMDRHGAASGKRDSKEMSLGPVKELRCILGVEAPARQGARSAHAGSMQATSNAARRDASASECRRCSLTGPQLVSGEGNDRSWSWPVPIGRPASVAPVERVFRD